ncbi:MAG: alkaline phosphatase PhoX [Candidatus Rokuibacteriota bacterium]
MTQQTDLDRRMFVRRGAMGAGALWMLSLGDFMGRRAEAAIASPYGPVSPKPDETTGLHLLQLPDGFRYASFSWTGDIMSDGVECPALHDGMAVVDAIGAAGDDDDRFSRAGSERRGGDDDDDRDGDDDDDDDDDDREHRGRRLILVRNHEVATGAPYLNRPKITYAPDGAGGTTNLIFDARRGLWEKAWSSLAGTVRNCAGGVTPWGTWLTSEETGVAGHGWNFEVGAEKGDPRPLVDMGRFSHEALMVDHRTGYVYQTEDAGDSGFYLFVPRVGGRLIRGGRLYMLKVTGQPNADLGVGYPIGTTWGVEWVPIADPAATTMSTYAQGAALGGARFRRLEGCWWGHRTGFFLSTDGGSMREGQVFEYDPRARMVKLIYDSPTFLDCDNPDNLTVTPRGGLILCEDNAGGQGQFAAGERLLGLTLHGEIFTFAINNVVLATAHNARVPAGDYRQAEWAGACYSPDGRWLFANIQTPGITFAITGPWGAGPL